MPINRDFPTMDWPEDAGPDDAPELIDSALALMSRNGLSPFEPQARFVIAPDPPLLEPSFDELQMQIETPLAQINYGPRNRGVAYACQGGTHVSRLLALGLDMRTASLAVLALSADNSAVVTDAEVAEAVNTYFNSTVPVEAYRWSALLFDSGSLIVCSGKGYESRLFVS